MQRLYYNGLILTMEALGDTVEAVLCDEGKILDTGKLSDMLKIAENDVTKIDIDNMVMLPAFIDSHSHLLAVAMSFLQAPLAETLTIHELKESILHFISDNTEEGEWVTATGYDHNILAEKRPPTVAELDEISPDNPLVVIHKSNHMGVLNSLALEKLKITADTPCPEGGIIEKENGVLTGYLEESAFIDLLPGIPMPDGASLAMAFMKAQEKYIANGITTVQEGMMVEMLIPMYQTFSEQGLMRCDVVGYCDIDSAAAFKRAFPERGYHNSFKLGGYKIFLDGSPQGKTAWMMTPYVGEELDYGYGTMPDEAVYQAIIRAVSDMRQLLAHCNGDAACEQFLKALKKAKDHGFSVAGIRPILIHAQLIDIPQLEKVKSLSAITSFFVDHVYFWGDTHIENFGKKRASRISPLNSAKKLDIPFSLHQDAPVLEPNMLKTISNAVLRKSKNGEILGEEERISPYDALKAITINAAYGYFEENLKGSIRDGKLANFVILDKNPLTVPVEEIEHIKVLATIKEGITIFGGQD